MRLLVWVVVVLGVGAAAVAVLDPFLPPYTSSPLVPWEHYGAAPPSRDLCGKTLGG
jgi:hypothetical protein